MTVTPLSLSTGRSDDGSVVLAAAGELDLSNITTFTEALADALTASAKVTVDLRNIEYLDSAAINVLYYHPDQIRLIANPVLMPVLKVSGLADVVPVEPVAPGG